MNTFDQTLNKGIPNDVVIDIPFADFINLGSNKERTYNILGETLLRYYERILSTLGRGIKFFYTNKQVRISTNPEDLGKYITISPTYIEDLIEMSLNPHNIWSIISTGQTVSDIEVTDKDISERMALLKKTKNFKQLEREFPCLYKTYKDALKVRDELRQLQKKNPIQYLAIIRENHIDKGDFALFDSLQSPQTFIDYVYKTLELVIENKEQLQKLALSDKMNTRIFGRSSAERLELYIADSYAEIAEQSTSDLKTKQKCSYYYLSAYMFENANQLDDGRTVERLISNAGPKKRTEVITKRSVYNKFKKLLIDNPELFNVNFDNHIFSEMTVEEIDALMASYMQSLKVKWDIIPDGHDIVFEPFESSTPKSQSATQTPSKTKKDPTELFYEKKAFFDSSDPFLRVMGKDTFNGYIGYIYPNGTVILDKFYEDSTTKKLAEDVAIYCMEIDDFYRLSQLSKSEIIRDRLCKRFYHRGDWQTRVKSEISGKKDANIEQKTLILKQLNETTE